jgi:TonB-dependent receptor
VIQAKLAVSDVDSFRNDDTNSANFTARIPGFSVALDGEGVPRFTFPAGLSMEDNAPYYTTQLQYRPSENELEERQASADFDITPDLPFIKSFEAGIQQRETTSVLFNGGGYHDYVNNVDIPNLNINLTGNLVAGTQANTVTPGTTFNAYNLTYAWNTATFNEALNHSTRSPGTFYNGFDVGGGAIPTDWRVPVFDDLAPMYNTEHFTHDELRDVTVNGTVYNRLPAHDLTEDIFAEYFKINFETDVFGMRLSGNVGVRQVNTETSAAGAIVRNERRPGATPGTFTDVNTGTVHSSFARDYSDTLPSANFQFQIKENFNIRLGYAELMSRPAITDLAPTGTCTIDVRPGFATDADADDCNIGNPALKPDRAKSYDLEFAYYPTPEVELRLGGFYKDINNYILGRVTFANVNLFGDGVLYDVTTPINGEGAKTQGIETSVQAPFTFLPGWASGFGGLANYTWTDAKDVGLFSQLDGAPLPFPGLSENSYNLVLYYDKGPINARVAWNSRSDWLVSAADRSGNPVFRAGEDFLDARLQWRIKGEELSVFIEGKNLTDQASLSYAGDRIRLSELGWPGRRYFMGVSWKPIS